MPKHKQQDDGGTDSPEPPGATVPSTDDDTWWRRADLDYHDGMLRFDATDLATLVAGTVAGTDETPCYVYRPARAIEKAAMLRVALPNVRILYAVKANRHPEILRAARESVDGIDVCSPNEARLALSHGFRQEQISYTGTSLSESDVAFLVEHSAIHVNVDSFSSLRRLAARSPQRAIGFRINPELGIGYRNESRLVYASPVRPSKFGFLAEQIPEALAMATSFGCRVTTVHWHVGCGWLANELGSLRTILQRATAIAATIPTVTTVNLGGGFGVPFQHDDGVLPLDRWSEIVRETLGERWAITIEPGAFLVQDAGVLLARVNTVERKRDTIIVGVNAGFNLAMEPVFYGMPLLPLHVVSPPASRPREVVTIAGNINEAHDLLARDVLFPVPEEGEWLAFLNAGAYAAAMSSQHCLRGEYREVVV
ncbi:MAG: hypothetical protein ACRC46_03940 [Thermoguttaceae bacterium]